MLARRMFLKIPLLSQLKIVVPVTLVPQDDRFTNQAQVYQLSAIPYDDPLVFVNGILTSSDIDYTLSGQTLTFTNLTIDDSPIIRVKYFKQA